jgi:hypothetical protein
MAEKLAKKMEELRITEKVHDSPGVWQVVYTNSDTD